MTANLTTMSESKYGALPLIGATAFTLILLGGAALWLLRPSTGPPTSATTDTTRTATERAAPIGGLTDQLRDDSRTAARSGAATVELGGLAELYEEQAARQTADQIVYVAASPEQAQTILDFIRAANHALGEPALVASVVVFDSADAETQFVSTLAERNQLREGDGMAPIVLLDLRGRSLATTPGDGVCGLHLHQTTCPPSIDGARVP